MMEDIKKKVNKILLTEVQKDDYRKKVYSKEEQQIEWVGGVKELHRQ